MARDCIHFLHNGRPVELRDVGPTDTVLDYLRLREGSVGTKEGCAEGDCGACTIALGRPNDFGGIDYEPVNSCILMMGQIDGRDLVSVDDLASESGELHPVQDAMVRHHGSQCGFCTPGIVMSLFTLYQSDAPASRENIDTWLAGNLCRCTGYRPIVAAARESCGGPVDDKVSSEAEARIAAMNQLGDDEDVFIGDEDRFLAAPTSEAALAALLSRHPDATMISGATDVGLWVTKQLRSLPKTVFLNRIKGFDRVEATDDRLTIGAGATYEQAEGALTAIDPDIGALIRRLGSKQVRASGTVGGNIANGSPIGDMPPVLIALDASVTLKSVRGDRVVALEDFFIDYGKQDRRPDEFVSSVSMPALAQGQHFRCYKISKRFDQDISAVMAGFRFSVEGRFIHSSRIAYGGMAAITKRAAAAEAALTGVSLDAPDIWSVATDALERDFTPIDDMRASANYRMAAAKGVLIKALTEIAGETSDRTRVSGRRDDDGGRHDRAA